MRKARQLFLCMAVVASATVPFGLASADDEGSRVVGEHESCPAGMVVSGMSGGEGDVTKVCVRPNSPDMPNDETDYSQEGNEGVAEE